MTTTPRADPLAFLEDEVAALNERHLYRALRVMSSAQGPIVSVDEKRVVSLSSNDYLGLTHHPRLRDAALQAIFDPFGNAVHTALAFPVLGEDVLVVGAGPIGLMATAVARHAGARHIVVSEPNAFRRDLAMRMGATLVVDPRARTLKDAQDELGMVEGFDVVFEMSGNANALRDALANMAHGAGMAILGIPTAEIPIDVSQIVFNQLSLRGIYGREMYETWYKMTVMLQSGLAIGPVITHRFDHRDFEAAFATARSGESGKVIMDWTT